MRLNGIEITYGHDELVIGIYIQVLMEGERNLNFARFCREWGVRLISHNPSAVVRQFTGFKSLSDIQQRAREYRLFPINGVLDDQSEAVREAYERVHYIRPWLSEYLHEKLDLKIVDYPAVEFDENSDVHKLGFNVPDVQVPGMSAGAIQNCRYVLSVYADRLLLNPMIGLSIVSRELGIDPICVRQWMRCVGLGEKEMQKAARLLLKMRAVDEDAHIAVKPHRLSDDLLEDVEITLADGKKIAVSQCNTTGLASFLRQQRQGDGKAYLVNHV